MRDETGNPESGIYNMNSLMLQPYLNFSVIMIIYYYFDVYLFFINKYLRIYK
jgi:hypothetical protein